MKEYKTEALQSVMPGRQNKLSNTINQEKTGYPDVPHEFIKMLEQ